VICWWREIDYDEPWVKRLNKLLTPMCETWMRLLDLMHPPINYVKIDHYDTWSLDSTLSPIILPMLRQLKATKHGAPFVDDADVPVRLRTNHNVTGTADPDVHRIHDGVDKKFFKRWDYVLDEMIWTFTQLSMNDHEAPFYDHSLANNPKDDLDKQVRKIKVDHVGLKKHNERIDNGLKLFGKYYRSLWD
jgi:hypothetical protein